MSLLMDALKKAEKAKQEKAQSESGEQSVVDSGELSLEESASMRMTTEELRQAAEEEGLLPPKTPDLSMEPVDTPESGPSSTQGYALEDSSPLGLEAEEPGVDTGEREASRPNRLINTEANEVAAFERTNEQDLSTTQSQTLPSMKNVQQALKDFYQETGQQAKLVDEEDAIPTRRLDPVDTQESQRSARNVFAAKQGREPRRKGGSAIVWGGLVVVVLMLGGGYYFYLSYTNVTPIAPRSSPIALRKTPPLPQATPEQAVVPIDAGMMGLVGEAPTAIPAGASPGTSQPPVAEPPIVAEAGVAPPEVAGAQAAREEMFALATTPEPALEPTPMQLVEQVSEIPAQPEAQAAQDEIAEVEPEAVQQAEALAMAEVATPPPSAARPPAKATAPIRIRRQQVEDPVYPLLERAYEAFNSGSDGEANRLYEEVLLNEPDNRNAVLGLAALAVRQDQPRVAYEHYLALLRLNPKDTVAQAAVIGLQGEFDPIDSESRLKLLLDRDPNAGYLYFGLGNLYAAQSRWSEAQQAYFNAYRADDENADYVYNLAVSLDQLGQAGAALGFYRQAVELSSGQAVAFDAQVVTDRILILSQETASTAS